MIDERDEGATRCRETSKSCEDFEAFANRASSQVGSVTASIMSELEVEREGEVGEVAAGDKGNVGSVMNGCLLDGLEL
jgi:hypothetical protein